MNTPVLNSIIDLAHQLKVKIVLEGVETQAQMDHLVTHHVEWLQGYFLYKPMSFSQLKLELIDKAKSSPTT
ncbi:MAG: EAL domain-containing protein [Vibrio hibernica]